jgi:hypothetical protein
MVAERAFVAERLGRVNVAFDDEVGVGQNGFQFGQKSFQSPANLEKNFCSSAKSFQSKPPARSINLSLSAANGERAGVSKIFQPLIVADER